MDKLQFGTKMTASTLFLKFVIRRNTHLYELRKAKGTSKFMILVQLSDLTFLDEFAAGVMNFRSAAPVEWI
jgi:hypothetical protein